MLLLVDEVVLQGAQNMCAQNGVYEVLQNVLVEEAPHYVGIRIGQIKDIPRVLFEQGNRVSGYTVCSAYPSLSMELLTLLTPVPD